MCHFSFSTSDDRSREMATLFKYFKKQSLPTSNEAELPDAVTREANKAMEKILEEERSRRAGICEAVDEADSDCDSEDDPFADIDEQ